MSVLDGPRRELRRILDGGTPQWVTVARMLELAEIYVPYDNGTTAFLDIHDMSFYMTPARKEFLGPACVAPGEVLQSSNPYWSGTVHKEIHDDGVRWMSAETNERNQLADRARRGEKMILWGTYYGANYRYMIEYGFGARPATHQSEHYDADMYGHMPEDGGF